VYAGYISELCKIAAEPDPNLCYVGGDLRRPAEPYNTPARTLSHVTCFHDMLPSLDMLPDWTSPPRWHTCLFDVTLTYHSTDFQIVHGRVVPGSSPHQMVRSTLGQPVQHTWQYMEECCLRRGSARWLHDSDDDDDDRTWCGGFRSLMGMGTFEGHVLAHDIVPPVECIVHCLPAQCLQLMSKFTALSGDRMAVRPFARFLWLLVIVSNVWISVCVCMCSV